MRATILLLILGIFTPTLSLFGQTFELIATNVVCAAGANLVKGTDGNFYGTTIGCGNLWGNTYAGTVFKVTPQGQFTTVAAFDGTAGAVLYDGIIQGTNGSFYGMARYGGDLSLNNGLGYGTVFAMALDGSLSALVTFESDEGYDYGHRGSTGTMLQAPDGSLYGVTPGEISTSQPVWVVPGTVFKAAADGSLTDLVTFTGANGSYPNGGLTQGSDGSFYGTTMTGGNLSLQGPYAPLFLGLGTVFRITPDGSLTTLVKFNGSNGAYPRAGLILATDGNFYGTCSYGGAFQGGTVFKMTPEGVLTTLVSFRVPSNQPQFALPFSGPWTKLAQARDGNFYGTTCGWNSGGGTVFKLTPGGVLTTLAVFDGTNGVAPAGALVQGDDGELYGLSGNFAFGVTGTFYRVVLPPSQPVLNIAQSGTQLVLSWPTNAAGFTLQSALDPSGSANWVDSTNTPVQVADQYFVTNTISGVVEFYRLRQ